MIIVRNPTVPFHMFEKLVVSDTWTSEMIIEYNNQKIGLTVCVLASA